MDKIKEYIYRYILEIKEYLLERDIEYPPLEKCMKMTLFSIIGFVFTVFISIYALFKDRSLLEIFPTLTLLCLLCSVCSVAAGVKTREKLVNGEIISTRVTIINASRINVSRKVEAVTEDEDNLELVYELDMKLKKNHKYQIYYFERNGENIVTYAKQVSRNRKK